MAIKNILIYIALCILFCLSFTSCNNNSNEDNKSIVEDNFYLGHWNSEYAKHQYSLSTVIKFSSNGIVELVQKVDFEDNAYDKYYGTYELDGKKLLITLSLTNDVDLTCIVHDEGENITISGEKFSKVESSELRDETLNQFDD